VLNLLAPWISAAITNERSRTCAHDRSRNETRNPVAAFANDTRGPKIVTDVERRVRVFKVERLLLPLHPAIRTGIVPHYLMLEPPVLRPSDF
jgi:hypothetical protein